MNIHALQFLKPERPPLFSDGLSAPLISSWDFLPICRKIIYHSTLECHTKKVRKCKEDGHHPDELSCLAKVACVQRTRQKSPRKENWIRLWSAYRLSTTYRLYMLCRLFLGVDPPRLHRTLLMPETLFFVVFLSHAFLFAFCLWMRVRCFAACCSVWHFG